MAKLKELVDGWVLEYHYQSGDISAYPIEYDDDLNAYIRGIIIQNSIENDKITAIIVRPPSPDDDKPAYIPKH